MSPMATMKVTGKQRWQADAWLKICKVSTGRKEGPEGHGRKRGTGCFQLVWQRTGHEWV